MHGPRFFGACHTGRLYVSVDIYFLSRYLLHRVKNMTGEPAACNMILEIKICQRYYLFLETALNDRSIYDENIVLL